MFTRALYVVLCIALIDSLGYNFKQYRDIQRANGVLFDWSYDFGRDIQVCRLRSDNSLVSIHYDLNRDLENDSSVFFDTKGRSAGAWIDRDYDGLMDFEYLLDRHGNIVSTYDDSDRDGRFEDYSWWSPDSIITHRDLNDDGFFGSDEIISRRGRRAY